MRNRKIIKANPSRFNRLVEYSFINTKETEEEKDELILGSDILGEEEGDEPSFEDLGVDAEDMDLDSEKEDSENMEGGFDDEEEMPEEEMPEEEDTSGVEVTDGEVELDVTDIVKSSEETTDLTTQAISKLDQLMTNFSELEDRLSNMEVITDKIDSLEKEIEKRNPTPVEKMEIRSLDSYPYNIKLTDFWKEKEGYDVSADEDKEVEYRIDDEEIENTYDEGSIKNSFGEPDAE